MVDQLASIRKRFGQDQENYFCSALGSKYFWFL
jgi:hypothetical protein